MNKKNMFDFKLLRKTVLVACCLLLVACKQEQSQGENAKKSNLINSGYLSMYAAGVRTSIARVFVRNGLEVQKIKNWDIDEKNFYKLDFSIEGQDTYGDNPEYEVFNPEGGGGAILHEELLTGLAIYPEVYYTIGNKAKGAKTNKTDLIFIVSNINEKPCKIVDAYSKRNQDIYEEIQLDKINLQKIKKINLTPYPQEVPENEIIELPAKYGCVETSDGYFYYHVLVER